MKNALKLSFFLLLANPALAAVVLPVDSFRGPDKQ